MVSCSTDKSSSLMIVNFMFDRKCSFLNLYSVYVFSSKRDNELLLRLIANLNMLLRDESVNVVKKAILTLTQLYKVTLQVNPGLIYVIFSFTHFALV